MKESAMMGGGGKEKEGREVEGMSQTVEFGATG